MLRGEGLALVEDDDGDNGNSRTIMSIVASSHSDHVGKVAGSGLGVLL